MDAVTTATAANPQVSADSYQWMGRQRADFWSGQANQAIRTGTDKVDLTFKDALDLVNPLQHLPIISSIYHAVTGDDDMKPAVKTVGDTIYGGPLAGVTSVFDDVFKEASGNDMLSTVASWLGLGDETSDKQMAAAAAPTAAAPDIAAAGTANSTATQSANNTAPITPVVVAAAASSIMPGAPTATAAANPAPATSPLFQKLQRGAAPQGQVVGSTQQKFFNPNAKQFSGITPASFRPSKDLANSNASIALEAKIQSNDITAAAAKSSNAVIASNMQQQAAKTADTVQAPQSEFAQKMLAAMDRYEAAKKTGDDSTPAVSQGL